MSDTPPTTGSGEGSSEVEPEGGPGIRQAAFLSERLAQLRPKGTPLRPRAAAAPQPLALAVREAGLADTALGDVLEVEGLGGPPTEALGLETGFRLRRVQQFRASQRGKMAREAAASAAARAAPAPGPQIETAGQPAPPELPAPPPANNWIPIGPSVLRQGQAATQPATSGRCAGIGVTPGGGRVYAATANGGVWRSEDAGETWQSLMNAFDLNPTQVASDSLACGAIALVPGASAGTDRIYVGSGEAHGGSGAMFGVGPIMSPDGGGTWLTEPVSGGSSPIAGSGFYALAVDPNDPDRVVGATRVGLYRRQPRTGGGFEWDSKILPGAPTTRVTSVVAADDGGSTVFYAVVRGGAVYTSPDGHDWDIAGAGFPTDARVSLAVQPDNSSVVYAFGESGNVWRLDTADGNWIAISGLPAPGALVGDQGWYDLAVAVAPNNVNRIYLGGSTIWSNTDWSGALYRCDLTVSTSGGSITAVSAAWDYIGNSVHADIHALTFEPGDANKLWVGCDGGVFYTANATGISDTLFSARNVGLQTLSMHHLGLHPSEAAVAFCGTQDNGANRYTGEEAWLYSASGDCGYFVVNWNNPFRVLNTYTRAAIRRSSDGGQRNSYGDVDVPVQANEAVLFYSPLRGTPANPAAPAEAEIVSFGSIRPWITTNFGTNWQSIPNGDRTDDLVGPCRSLAFASASKLYAGTFVGWVSVAGSWVQYTDGAVYRFDLAGGAWTRTRIDIAPGDDLPLDGSITDIAVDPADATGNSIYITFGGNGDYRHIWHFDGTDWEQRSGPSAGHADSLLDVQHNAIVVDPDNPTHIYAGADIGIWRSTDSGATWAPYSEGLPDAAVMDLQLHRPSRLLRASTHGRSVWERRLDAASVQGVELYVRDTQLDEGRYPTVNGLDDPTAPGETVRHWRGPDIKVDTPDAMGNHQFPVTGSIDFHDFVDTLSDDSSGVATHATATITSRVYVQVHNRGVATANDVQVMCLLANASAGLPALPVEYETNVRAGAAINTPDWQTVGIVTLDDVRVGFPKIAAFDLVSSMLPPPANLAGNDHHCVLALLHHADDPYTSTETNTDLNSRQERKAAHKNLKIVQFTGTLPSPPPAVMAFRINNGWRNDRLLTGLRLRLAGYPGKVRLVMPKLRFDGDVDSLAKGMDAEADLGAFEVWAKNHLEFIEQNQRSEHPYNKVFSLERRKDVEAALAAPLQFVITDAKQAQLSSIVMEPASHHTMFLMLEANGDVSMGKPWPLEIEQLNEDKDETIGGLDVRVERVPEPDIKKYYLRLWMAPRQTRTFIGAQLYDSDGETVTPDQGAKVVLTLSAGFGGTKDLGAMGWHGSWRYYNATIGHDQLSERDALKAVGYLGDTVVDEAELTLFKSTESAVG